MSNENAELRKVGLKVTEPRIKIFRMLKSLEVSSEHCSAEDVYNHLRNIGETVGLATVYRVLMQFEQAGLVKRHNFDPSGHSVFELTSDEHHDHIIDVDTDEVIEFCDDVIEKRQREIAEAHGYELIDHSLVLYVCKKKKSEAES